jgi:hypothetical protein
MLVLIKISDWYVKSPKKNKNRNKNVPKNNYIKPHKKT